MGGRASAAAALRGVSILCVSVCAIVAISLERLQIRGDDVKLICEATYWFKDNIATLHLGTDYNVRAYVESCRSVFPEMGGEVQKRLLRMLHTETLDAALPVDPVCPPKCNRPYPAAAPEACAVGVRRKPDISLGKHHAAYQEAGIRPLQIPDVDLAGILPAWQRGEVARFDATKLLPKRLFNLTIRDIHRMYEDVATSTGLYVQNTYGDAPFSTLLYRGDVDLCQGQLTRIRDRVQQEGTRSLFTRLQRLVAIPYLLGFRCHAAPSLATVAELSKNFSRRSWPFDAINGTKVRRVSKEMDRERRHSRALGNSNLNIRRLPGFLDGVDLEERLGVKGTVARVHNFLWFGASHGFLHADAQDNILVQLHGTVELIVVPSNCTSLVLRLGLETHGDVPWLFPSEGELVQPTRNAPFYHFWLHPGQGAVIPSSTQHRIVSTTSDRVGLNAFFEPKFGEMMWPRARSNFYRHQNRDVLAVRSLWMQTLAHLFDTRGLLVAMHTSKLEYI